MPHALLSSGEYVLTADAVRVLAETPLALLSLSATRDGAAELLVALANSDAKKAFVSADFARKALAEISEKYRKQVEKFWEDAHHEAMELLLLVLENNPKKDKTALFARPDIQSALTEPYREAALKSEALLGKAFTETTNTTVKHLKGEFKLLKEDWQGYDSDYALLDSLVGDLRANAEALRERYLAAVEGKDSDFAKALTKVTNDATRRAGYSTTTLVWGTATDVRASAFLKAGLNKMWIAVIDKQTCSHCKALHGTVLPPTVEFSKEAGTSYLKAYRGLLQGPPRHPNCRCILVGTKLKKT